MTLNLHTLALMAAVAASCLGSASAVARNTSVLLPLSPAPGVSARIEKQGSDYVLVQPGGARLALLSDDDVEDERGPDIEEQDYNFDGYPDVAVSLRAGMVNIATAIWTYDPGTKTYVPFEVPASVEERQNCKGLWNVERLVERKALRSNCRGGPRWHADILQVGSDGSLWLAGQTREPEETPGWPYFGKPSRGVIFDRQGKVLSEAVLSFEDSGVAATWVVPASRLALYAAPEEQAITKGYLIEGDETTMLAFQGDAWMKIGYEGKAGRIVRWVSLKEAYDLARRYDPASSASALFSLWAMDYQEVDDDPDCYRNLFTLSLQAKGDEGFDLYDAEVHLIYTGADGDSVVHKLYDVAPAILKAGETHVLDDNPVERHGERHVIFHAAETGPEYVPFFPEGLAPGRYRIRPVLTAPNLPGPLYAKDVIEMDYPPQLAPALIKP